LDKDTSGVMVVAKDDTAHQGLAAQLADNSMGRIYNAVCVGVVLQDKIKIDAHIGRHPVNRKKMAIVTDAKTINSRSRVSMANEGRRARHAVTYVEVLKRFEKYTLVSARLETGRTHQIRVHMAHIGHPVLGDVTYGSANQPTFLQSQQGQVLHATEVSFIHPVTKKNMTHNAPWPEYFKDAIDVINSGSNNRG